MPGVSVLGGILEIDDVIADHEGIYRCVYNGGQDVFNLTVVGKQDFTRASSVFIVHVIFIYFGLIPQLF